MDNILILILTNLEKIGVGIGLFMGAYLANMCLGVWRNVRIQGYNFDWRLIAQSVAKFVVLGLGIGLMSIVVSILPQYMTYVGIDVSDDTMQVFDSIVIITAFMSAAIRYVKDAYDKLKDILGA